MRITIEFQSGSQSTNLAADDDFINRDDKVLVICTSDRVFNVRFASALLAINTISRIKQGAPVSIHDNNAGLKLNFHNDASLPCRHIAIAKIKVITIGEMARRDINTMTLINHDKLTNSKIRKALADMNIELHCAVSDSDGTIGYAPFDTEAGQFIFDENGDLMIHVTAKAMLTALTSFVELNYMENLAMDFEKLALNDIFKTPDKLTEWQSMFSTFHHIKNDKFYTTRIEMLTEAAKQKLQAISLFYDDNVTDFDLAELICDSDGVDLENCCNGTISVVPTPNGGYRLSDPKNG